MTKNDLIDCHDRIKPFIHNTPVLTSKLINNLTGADIYFKCENFQKMGAFKMRGAANAFLNFPMNKKVMVLLRTHLVTMHRLYHLSLIHI